jgi:hypothetical protein
MNKRSVIYFVGMNKCVPIMNQRFCIRPVNHHLLSTQHTLKRSMTFSFLGTTQSFASTVFTSVMKLIPSLILYVS